MESNQEILLYLQASPTPRILDEVAIMPEPIEMRKARLSHIITTLETLVDDNDGHISGHAIGHMEQARAEAHAELYLLGEDDHQ